MNIDFHCHTSLSYDGFSSYEGLAKAAEKKNIEVIFVTEHDKINSDKNMIFKIKNVTFIKGCEFTASNGAHIIGLFIDKELNEQSSSYQDIFKHIKKNNGLISLPHPFKPDSGLFSIEKNFFKNLDLKDVDLIELFNGGYSNTIEQKNEIIEIAKKNNIKLIGASDAHKEIHLGYFVTKYRQKNEDIYNLISKEQGSILFDSSFKNFPRKVNKIQKNRLFIYIRDQIRFKYRILIKRFLYFFKKKLIQAPQYTLKYPND